MRRFELSEGESRKFWEVEVSGAQIIVRFGRIGTNGQRKVKSFADPGSAQDEAHELMRLKLAKGYQEVKAITQHEDHVAASAGSIPSDAVVVEFPRNSPAEAARLAQHLRIYFKGSQASGPTLTIPLGSGLDLSLVPARFSGWMMDQKVTGVRLRKADGSAVDIEDFRNAFPISERIIECFRPAQIDDGYACKAKAFACTLIQHPGKQTTDELFEGGGAGIVWVDWREEDHRIVSMVAGALGRGDLAPRMDGENLSIDFRGVVTRVPLGRGSECRDITLKVLNQALQPDFEIRFVKASDGGDTLAFMALPAAAWRELETAFGKKVDKALVPLDRALPLFGDPTPEARVGSNRRAKR